MVPGTTLSGIKNWSLRDRFVAVSLGPPLPHSVPYFLPQATPCLCAHLIAVATSVIEHVGGNKLFVALTDSESVAIASL